MVEGSKEQSGYQNRYRCYVKGIMKHAVISSCKWDYVVDWCDVHAGLDVRRAVLTATLAKRLSIRRHQIVATRYRASRPPI